MLVVIAPIWHERPETARRVRQRIAAVMQWAVAMAYRADNPRDRVAATLGRQGDVARHMRGLPHAEVASAVATVWASRATTPAKLAFEFLVLTVTRSGEVRLTRWEEIDLRADVWTVPAEHMKTNPEHRVPLSSRAGEILAAAATLRNGCDLVFPSPRGKPLSDTTLSKLLKDQGIQAVPHGFRSSSGTRLPRRPIIRARSSRPRSCTRSRTRSRRRYARSTLFERRRGPIGD